MKPQQLSLLIALLTVAAIVAGVLVKPKFGLDIQGGARVVLEADLSKLPQGRKWDAETRQAVLRTIENRVNANGVSEPVITSKGDRQFVVEIPAIRNRNEVLEQLQTTAQLQFFYSPDWRTNRNQFGKYDIGRAAGTDNRELYQITDTSTKKTFRDLFQVNQEIRAILERGAKAGDKAKDVPLPTSLQELSSTLAAKTLRVEEADVKRLDELAEEVQNFNTFLGSAREELNGSDILPTARSGFDQAGRGAVIELEFNDRGRTKFGNFTRDHTQEILLIYLDGRILTAPNINEPILNGHAQISGFATLKEAKQTADLLNGGSLPVPLKMLQLTTIEATLGDAAMRQSAVAGLIGLALVAIFMIGYYKIPGAIAVGALLLYTLFTYAIFVLIPVTFTLPGIAGFILSIGMAVDANILIFERTKEELRHGKGMRQAIEAGFQRAFSAILDSNVCTAVTSILLYYLGTGAVRGFALTLLIGVAVSMFTAITVSRTFLLLFTQNGIANTPDAWAVNRQINPHLNVVQRRYFWYGLSLAVIVPGIIFAMMGGFKPGIDFTGGSELTLKFPPSVSANRQAIEKNIAAQGIEDPAAQMAGDNTVFVRLPKQKDKGEVTSQQADTLVEGLAKEFPGVTKEGFETIGSSISTELTRNALTSILYSSIFIVIYLAFRFAIGGGFASGIKFGAGAIIAMLHDVLLLIGVFCALGYLLNWKIDSLFVTAALTVIGFSVHDTIVIFDRIRENLKLRSKNESFELIVNDSINETFARSVFTSLTVMITLLALLIFGGAVIRPLNAALLIGIISGTYSSIFNAAPLVVDWQRRFGSQNATGKQSGSKPSTGGTTSSARTTDRPTNVATSPNRPLAGRTTSTPPGPSGPASDTSQSAINNAPKPRRRRM